MISCIVVGKKHVKYVKNLLEKNNSLHKDYRITQTDNDCMAVPFIKSENEDHENFHLISSKDCQFSIKYINETQLLPSKITSPQIKLKNYIENYLLCKLNLKESNVKILSSEIPLRWDIHGDLVMFPDTSFSSNTWNNLPELFWKDIASIMNAKRIALKSKIQNDDFRTPKVKLVLGNDVMVTHIDNGICYSFDITKNMFCKGNITEKLRIALWDCSKEIVLDMFAGIGYFTLPYLVKAHAKHVIAIEWNPDAVSLLRRNLYLNNISERCHVIEGDNRIVTPKNCADRVNLGLIPTSSSSWKAACEALKTETGGWLHIHGNIDYNPNQQEKNCYCSQNEICIIKHTYKSDMADLKRLTWCEFVHNTTSKLTEYLQESTSKRWTVNLRHIEYLKSYAPRVDNLVFDIECRPVLVDVIK